MILRDSFLNIRCKESEPRWWAWLYGAAEDVDYILGHLTPDMTLAATKFVDYALSLVESSVGVERVEHYLFNGTQMQRNYCSLFFNRRGD